LNPDPLRIRNIGGNATLDGVSAIIVTVSAHGGRLETDLGLEIVPLHLELVAQLEQTLRLLHIALTYITLLANRYQEEKVISI
jgi:hypothetical protein